MITRRDSPGIGANTQSQDEPALWTLDHLQAYTYFVGDAAESAFSPTGNGP